MNRLVSRPLPDQAATLEFAASHRVALRNGRREAEDQDNGEQGGGGSGDLRDQRQRDAGGRPFHGGEQHHPQEVGIPFDALADVVDEAVSLGQMVGVPERDEPIVYSVADDEDVRRGCGENDELSRGDECGLPMWSSVHPGVQYNTPR
jgi:hypothetical protein